MRHTRARDLLPLENPERQRIAATDVPPASSKSNANPLWRGLGSIITPTGGGSAHPLSYFTFTESRTPNFHPAPSSTVAIDKTGDGASSPGQKWSNSGIIFLTMLHP